jgi:hypothetical protein
VLPNSGPGSLASYQALLPGKPWTQFLTAWATGGSGGATTALFDQGEERRFEAYLVWEPAAVARGTDVDLMILEPNGNLYVPFLGTVTPNGHLTSDSYDTDTFYEGYLTNRFVQPGRYQFFALLFADPQNFRPNFDLQYRFAQANDFSSVHAPDYPELSTAVSWLNDPAFTIEKVLDEAYTDLKLAAYVDIGPGLAPSGMRAGTTGTSVRPSLQRSGAAAQAAGAPRTRITPEQASRVRQALRTRRAQAATAGAAATPPVARHRTTSPAGQSVRLTAPARRERP